MTQLVFRAFGLGAAALLLTGSVWGQRTDTAGPPTTTVGVQPVYTAGNPICWDFRGSSNYIHAKYNVGETDPTKETFENKTYTVEGGTITVSNFNGKFFDFTTNLNMHLVFVKAGNGGNLFTYNPPVQSDTGLHGPVAPNGNVRDISHVSFCWTIPQGDPTSETAFARGPGTNADDRFAIGGDTTTCFINLGQISRWGWTMGPLAEGTYTWDLVAGAGNCRGGTVVGSVTVVYSGGTATVTYNMNSGFWTTATHVYIGSAPFPTGNNGQPTVAPGQYTHVGTAASYSTSGLSGPIYVIAHAAVTGNFN
jgi:hypothetical protein